MYEIKINGLTEGFQIESDYTNMSVGNNERTSDIIIFANIEVKKISKERNFWSNSHTHQVSRVRWWNSNRKMREQKTEIEK